jgi:DNA-binding transcriptional ArsR family regulator
MYRFHLTPEDLAQVRFAVDPLWECVASVRVLTEPGRHAVHYPWVVETAAAVRDLDLGVLRQFVRGGACPPHFIAPPPDVPDPEFPAQVERLRRMPAEIVRGDVRWLYPHDDTLPTAMAAFLHDTGAALDRLVELVHAYWERAIAPHWSRFQAILEGDILHRARLLALEGAAGLLRDLHPQVCYAGGTVHVEVRAADRDVRPAGRGLLLVPSIFAWPDVAVATDPAWRPTLRYAARGIADLWLQGAAPETDEWSALAELIGPTRARLLLQLVAPMTTGEVARRVGTTAGAVSQHLTALAGAGMLGRTRVGRRVYYQRSARSERVLEALRP